jgi:hypothetical protein
VCAWFGLIPSTAQVVGSVKKKYGLWVWSAHQETCGGYLIDRDGGDKGKNKDAELDKNIFNNQQRLEAAMEGKGGGGADGGGIMTNANGACNTSSLNNVIHIQ